jgi:hypothetical protein
VSFSAPTHIPSRFEFELVAIEASISSSEQLVLKKTSALVLTILSGGNWRRAGNTQSEYEKARNGMGEATSA